MENFGRKIVAFFFFLSIALYGARLDFDLYKKGEAEHALLVIGGIHGDEPGGYFAASFLVKHYKITEGELWVVPNLNFDSIVRFKRGVYGDMNRKFAEISPSDPDYEHVKRIKEIILKEKVHLVLNLHDGRGYYRKRWENTIFNPAAWGQACIIDQEFVDGCEYGNLSEMAKRVNEKLNRKHLKEKHHIFNIKNTRTKFKDEQMRLSLTYFAITHNKPALAIETSKNIEDLATKIYYQLSAIEEFMKIMGIEFQRDFELCTSKIEELISKSGSFVEISRGYILPLDGLRSYINYFPVMDRGAVLKTKSDDPLAAVVKRGDIYTLQRGHLIRSRLRPQYFQKGEILKSVDAEIDGKEQNISIPSIVDVKESFKILAPSNLRVNVIGFSQKGIQNENNIEIGRDEIMKRYSVDSEGRLFRVEFYEKKSFRGSFLVRFQKK